jgi:MFS family permease
MAACGVGLAWASWTHAPLVLIYALLFGTGTFRALGWPASTAIVTGLVPAKDFSNAATWRSNTYQLASTLGPLTGGFLLAWWSPVIVFLIDAASSLILATCMLFVKPRPQTRAVEPKSWRGFLQGIHFLRRQPVILSTMTLDMVAVLFGGVVALLPIYARDILEAGPLGLGILRAAPAVGALLMTIVLARHSINRHIGLRMFQAVIVFGVATVVFALSQWMWLSVLALAVLGAADTISVVIRFSLVQLATPDEMRGRVGAVNFLFINASNQLGQFESGVTAALLGTVPAAVLGGVGTIAIALLWMKLFPTLRKVERLE